MNTRQMVNNGMLFYEEGQLRQSRGQLLIALTAELLLTVEYQSIRGENDRAACSGSGGRVQLWVTEMRTRVEIVYSRGLKGQLTQF